PAASDGAATADASAQVPASTAARISERPVNSDVTYRTLWKRMCGGHGLAERAGEHAEGVAGHVRVDVPARVERACVDRVGAALGEVVHDERVAHRAVPAAGAD